MKWYGRRIDEAVGGGRKWPMVLLTTAVVPILLSTGAAPAPPVWEDPAAKGDGRSEGPADPGEQGDPWAWAARNAGSLWSWAKSRYADLEAPSFRAGPIRPTGDGAWRQTVLQGRALDAAPGYERSDGREGIRGKDGGYRQPVQGFARAHRRTSYDRDGSAPAADLQRFVPRTFFPSYHGRGLSQGENATHQSGSGGPHWVTGGPEGLLPTPAEIAPGGRDDSVCLQDDSPLLPPDPIDTEGPLDEGGVLPDTYMNPEANPSRLKDFDRFADRSTGWLPEPPIRASLQLGAETEPFRAIPLTSDPGPVSLAGSQPVPEPLTMLGVFLGTSAVGVYLGKKRRAGTPVR